MRVSLSDWLAFQARIRGSKDPRLWRDRSADGAALTHKFMGVRMGHCVKVYADLNQHCGREWMTVAATK